MTDTVTGENHHRRSDGDSNTGAAGPLNAAELATMFATLGGDAPAAATWSTSYAGARRILATIQHLESLVYVPGQWRCAKCKFVLYRRTIDMAAGRIGVSETDRNRPEVCPNECGPLWRVSEREAGKDVSQFYFGANEELSALLGGIPHVHIPAMVKQLVEERGLPGTRLVCTFCRHDVFGPGRIGLASGDVVECPEVRCPTRSRA